MVDCLHECGIVCLHENMSNAFQLRGCTAIITGASSGLGAEFARQISSKAAVLILAARSGDALNELATELQKQNASLQVLTCACDLATATGRDALWACVNHSNIQPTLLINNAGLGDYGDFADADEARITQQINLNITALTLIAWEFVRRSSATAEKPSAVLNISSLASVAPMAQMGVYAATKAYVSSLGESLRIELAARHVQVLTVCPGPTPTGFGSNARRPDGADIARSGQGFLQMPRERVVSIALRKLESNSARVFPGWRVTLAAMIFEKMPRVLLRYAFGLRYRKAERKTPL